MKEIVRKFLLEGDKLCLLGDKFYNWDLCIELVVHLLKSKEIITKSKKQGNQDISRKLS